MKSKLNNKGFSLIELLIAVIILALVTVPILSLFTASMRTAVKSGEIGAATTTAQNVAEMVEALDFSDVINSPELLFDTGAHYMKFEGNRYFKMTQPGNIGESEHHVGITGLSEAGHNFDVMITFDPGADGSELNALNTEEITRFTGVDGSYGQAISERDNPDIVSLENSKLEANIYPESILVAKQRHIILDIYHDAAEDTANATVAYEYRYTYEFTPDPLNAPQYKELIVFSGDEVNPSEVELFTASHHGATDDPPIIGLFYYPWYEDTTLSSVFPLPTGSNDDIITIRNHGNITPTVLLVKQKDADMSDSELALKESGYRPKINLQHLNSGDDPNAWNGELYTNMVENLGNEMPITGINYNISEIGSVWSLLLTDVPDGSLVKKDELTRLFNVKIEVFEEGSISNNFSQITKDPIYVLYTSKLI